MAERRMFSKSIIDSDAFLTMGATAQNLYFHFCLRADDDGFVNSPRSIQRLVGANDDDLRTLIAKRFVITFESGVIVIKHWRVHNYIQNDRHKPTVYQDEMSRLTIKENRAYTEKVSAGNDVSKLDTGCIQSESTLYAQTRLGKTRVDKKSIDDADAPTCPKSKYGQYGWVRLSGEEYTKLEKDLGFSEFSRCLDYVDESAQASGNKNKWKDWNLVIRKCSRDKWGAKAVESDQPKWVVHG